MFSLLLTHTLKIMNVLLSWHLQVILFQNLYALLNQHVHHSFISVLACHINRVLTLVIWQENMHTTLQKKLYTLFISIIRNPMKATPKCTWINAIYIGFDVWISGIWFEKQLQALQSRVHCSFDGFLFYAAQ